MGRVCMDDEKAVRCWTLKPRTAVRFCGGLKSKPPADLCDVESTLSLLPSIIFAIDAYNTLFLCDMTL